MAFFGGGGGGGGSCLLSLALHLITHRDEHRRDAALEGRGGVNVRIYMTNLGCANVSIYGGERRGERD